MSRALHLFALAAATATFAAVTACTQPAEKPTPDAPATSTSGEPLANPDYKDLSVTFGQDDAATNYDKNLVPDGSKMFVAEAVHEGLTTVVLDVRGFRPNRPYGAHAHVKPCGPKPDDAGLHFQHQADPVKPSVDPKFANPQNEIWLDFVTDAKGNATKAATVDWTFGEVPAGSVVIHAEPTKTAPGQAGMAGPRAACASFGF